MLSSDEISVEKTFFFIMKFNPDLLLEGVAPCSRLKQHVSAVRGVNEIHLQTASHATALTQPLSLISKISQGKASDDSMFVFIRLKTHSCIIPSTMLGAEPSKSEFGIKEQVEFKHKGNNKNRHKVSLRTERGITWSKGGTLPLSYFLSYFK